MTPFINQAGLFLGIFDQATPPKNGVAIASAPVTSTDTWDGTAWVPAPPPAPPPPPPIDARLWIERLSPTKQLAVATAGLGNAALLLWLLKAAGAQSGVVLSDPDTTSGVAALVSAGVLTTDDQATLLAP